MSGLPDHFWEGLIVTPLHEAVVWPPVILLAIAAYGDIKARIIPNRLCLALLYLFGP
jgi:Flp pilus assembly protein protease CpaA